MYLDIHGIASNSSIYLLSILIPYCKSYVVTVVYFVMKSIISPVLLSESTCAKLGFLSFHFQQRLIHLMYTGYVSCLTDKRLINYIVWTSGRFSMGSTSQGGLLDWLPGVCLHKAVITKTESPVCFNSQHYVKDISLCLCRL